MKKPTGYLVKQSNGEFITDDYGYVVIFDRYDAGEYIAKYPYHELVALPVIKRDRRSPL